MLSMLKAITINLLEKRPKSCNKRIWHPYLEYVKIRVAVANTLEYPNSNKSVSLVTKTRNINKLAPISPGLKAKEK